MTDAPRPAGVVSRRSPYDPTETVERLAGAVERAGATLFLRLDQRAEAEGAGRTLRPTTLLLFGNPAVGTGVMDAEPLAALDLPLRVVVWEDDDRVTWMTYLDASWLAERYALPADLRAPLAAPEALTAAVATVSTGPDR